MRYGFVIDNRRCIGCHACSVACKAENQVPLGVFRTWVKYVEKGRFPNTRRYFQVTRCNHCENPPCVAICPVGAMYQRKDGIVDLDGSRCIGCKACMQACPYDAIYLDPQWGTAAKCHYCAHRVDVGMEPACVVACPEHAIVAGDIDDPSSEISQLIERESVRVRRPEQETKPKLFYVEAEETAIVPGQASNVGTYLWATVNSQANRALAPVTRPGPPVPAVVAYDVEHARPWGWQVPVYFWTKSVSAGILTVPALASAAWGISVATRVRTLLGFLGLLFMGLTVALLVSDLSRRGRFLRVLTNPQPRSWLARGAYLLVLYSALCGAFFLSSWAGADGLASAFLWPAVVAGILAAVYTAFLFGQCEGCDLWQSPLLPLHLLAQCVLTSAAVLALLPDGLGITPELHRAAAFGLAFGLSVHGLIVLGELVIPHGTDSARRAAELITRGPLGAIFWGGAVGIGGVLPAVLLIVGWGASLAVGLAGASALVGLLAFEWCFVMAGQGVPNS